MMPDGDQKEMFKKSAWLAHDYSGIITVEKNIVELESFLFDIFFLYKFQMFFIVNV